MQQRRWLSLNTFCKNRNSSALLPTPRTNRIMIELPGYSQLWGAIAFEKAFFLYHPKERCPGKREDTKSS